MNSLVDTLIEYLHTELAGALPVHYTRFSSVDENTNQHQVNAVNVSLLGGERDGSIEAGLMSLDILASDEREGLAWCTHVSDILRSTRFVPEYDYSTTIPTALGRCIYWATDDIDFTVAGNAQHYVHFSLTLPVTHARI